MGETRARGARPRANVLLADDDGAVRSFFQIVLMQQGCAVTMAKDGDEAVSLLKSGQKFDIIFTDYLMPGRDGVDVLAIALQVQSAARRVLMSASLIDRELRDLAAEIADEILVKPVPIATVAALIDKFMGAAKTS